VLLIAIVSFVAFSGDDGGSDPVAGEGTADDAQDEPAPSLCATDPTEVRGASTDGQALSATDVVSAGFGCADTVTLVPTEDPTLAAIAAPLAAATDAPLLVGTADEHAELIEDLGEPEVRQLDADTDPTSTAIEVAEELGVDRFVAAAADRPSDLAGAAALAVRTGAAVLPVDTSAAAPELPDGAEVNVLGDLGDTFPDASPAEAPWVVDGGAELAWVIDPEDDAAHPAIVAAALRGDTVAPTSGGDLLGRRTVSRVRDAGLDAARLVPVGDLGSDDLERDLTLLADAPLLPGGTLRHFDGTRMVALYGLPGTPVLGVLGEQDLDASIERAREVSAGYDADGRTVIPTFEVIVTVASAEAGDDGQYSRVAPPEQFRELVDRAREEDIQVVLDLQPGRNDFLDQAMIYEELLREPHVGLALDPEWRLAPDEVHLRQIGRVEAEEVQRVVDWYAELTRDAGLPQQLLVLHQFRLSMLQDRDRIEIPDEIAAVVHADGQGPQGQKLETWQVLTRGAEDRWHWGWKNFYDEDPVVAEPGYILDLEPEVVFVTYQ
jgi:hypothetical protein